MSRLLLILAIIAALLFGWWCLKNDSPRIQADVNNRTVSALAENGLDYVTVSTNGRDVTLTGVVQSEEEKHIAGVDAANVWGVRKVINNLTVEGAPVAIPAAPVIEAPKVAVADPYEFKADLDKDRIVLSGYVPDEDARSKMLSYFRTNYPNATLVDNTKIAAGAPDQFYDVLPTISREIGKYETASFSLVNTDLSVTGSITSFDALKSSQDNINGLLPSNFKANYDVKVLGDVKKVNNDCQKVLHSMLAREKIQFETALADISVQSDALLNNIASVAKGCPNSFITIEGHTDSDGSEAMNQELSLMRSIAVVKRLISLGVPNNRMTALGFGENQPIANNTTSQGKALNRRIEFKLTPIE